MYRNVKKGWYKPKNQEKIIKPIDKYMNSYKLYENEHYLFYRSSLEYKAFQYADNNEKIIAWAVEPLHIKYIKPTDNKLHRYFIDMYIEFQNSKFLIEVKPLSQTSEPKKPKKLTQKSLKNYNNSLKTFEINQAKWKAAEKFAFANNMKFMILTDKHLGI